MMQALQTPTARVPCAPYPSPSRPPQLGRLIRLNARLLSNPESRLFPFPHLAPFPNHGYLLRAMAAAAEPSVQFNEELSSRNDTEKVKDVAELTLELLEWPRVLLVVSSFGGTASAKELIESFELPSTLGESETLLSMTAAAIDLLSHLGSSLDFGGIQSKLVDSCLVRLQKGFVINGQEALSIATLLQFTDTLQHDLKTCMELIGGSENILNAFLEPICIMGVQQEAVKAISKTVDEDGNVKDTASPELQRARVQYRTLETKVQELLRTMLRELDDSASTQDIDGRFCIAVSSENQRQFPGLLLRSSASGGSTSYIEPVALVSLNDKLGEARAAASKAEYEALRVLTKKLLPLVESLILLLEAVIQVDVVVARAKFSLTYEGSMPAFTGAPIQTGNVRHDSFGYQGDAVIDAEPRNRLSLQLRQAYHPLLLHKYKEHSRSLKAKSLRRKKEASVKLSPPVPIDISVSGNTRVVTITGPNTGGKTAAMKTLGLAALMAKSGLYVLAKEPAFLPWFDAVFADIGDEQSLFQSLSTFSGHLRRINGQQRTF